ncbi:MAG TPA: hypothetical protein VN668_15010 [Stellaceae bacterium]|nr:hypothetical protein [Stellaceae bacterium]
MPFPEEFIRWIEQEQARLQTELKEMESGCRSVSRVSGGVVIDITRDEAARVRKHLADLQHVLKKHREG